MRTHEPSHTPCPERSELGASGRTEASAHAAVTEAFAVADPVVVIRSAALALDRYHAWHGVHGSLCPAALAVTPPHEVTILPPAPTTGTTPGADARADARRCWSPQRRAGEPPRTSDDFYALGVIAVQLLQASRASLSPPDNDRASQVARVMAAVEALTSWSPSERPASGAELVRTLDAAISDTLPAAPTPTAALPVTSQVAEPASVAASRVARARRAHRLAQETPPRPVRPPRPRQVRAPLGKGHYPDMPLPTGWVAALVIVLCSVYLLPLYFMLFPSS